MNKVSVPLWVPSAQEGLPEGVVADWWREKSKVEAGRLCVRREGRRAVCMQEEAEEEERVLVVSWWWRMQRRRGRGVVEVLEEVWMVERLHRSHQTDCD